MCGPVESWWTTCPVCEGEGRQEAESIFSRVAICFECFGTGEVEEKITPRSLEELEEEDAQCLSQLSLPTD